MKKIAILGSTGQIGSQALEVIKSYPNEFEVVGLACQKPSRKFSMQVNKFEPKITTITNRDGDEKLIEVATHPDVDLVIVAVVGIAGLLPTLEAIKKGKDIALATKEVLVIAGELVMKEVKKHQVKLIPLDSEHSALFQSLKSGQNSEIRNIYLTMGSGKIAKMTQSEMEKVKYKDVCQRKTWTMGQKIAIDSATCINKVFEIIEARHLFNLKPEQIKVIVHPEYICHSLVEFIDGSIITELGVPDMRRYLQYALFYPQRKKTRLSSFVNLFEKKLSFYPAPTDKFPCLRLAHRALKVGGNMSAVLHGADRATVEAFIKGTIKFTQVFGFINQIMKKTKVIKKPTLKQLIQAENKAYVDTKKIIKNKT